MAVVIVETTDMKGSLHSSYVVVDGLEHRSVIDNLVVAIHQSNTVGHQRVHQPTEESPAENDEQLLDDEEDQVAVDDDIKATIYVDCQPVGTVSLASSLRHMIQQSGTLQAVNISPYLYRYT